MKIREDVYNALLRMQGLLQYRDKKKWPFSDIIMALISYAPEIEVPMDEELQVVAVDERKSDTQENEEDKSQ